MMLLQQVMLFCSKGIHKMTSDPEMAVEEGYISPAHQAHPPFHPVFHPLGSPGRENEEGSDVFSTSRDTVSERGRNRSWLLSSIITFNVLILGIALVSGSVFNNVKINAINLQIFLIVLIILTTAWMLYYTIYTSREDHAVLYKDSHAGPVWLRGGLVLFGLCSLIMDVFKIANYVGYLHCDSAVKIAFPVVQAVFILVQTYFLWLHAKDCVQLQRNITRCGLMLTLSTNLMLWMAAVTEESIHQTVVPPEDNNSTHSYDIRAPGGSSSCNCSHSACAVLEKAYYYLYPFNIEYSLFASAMAYVMWKNVGRLVDEHNHHALHFRLKDVPVGPAVGLVMLVAGLGTFVIYKVDVEKGDPGKRDTVLMIHYVMNTVAVTLMSASTVAGCAIYRLDQRDHVSGKNPTRSLDVGLLIGASFGQFTICYFTIVAVVAMGAEGHLNALNLAVSLLTVIQLCLQNIFIIEGLHREPFHEDMHRASVFTNPYVLQAHRDIHNLPGTFMETKTSPALTVHSMHVVPSAPSSSPLPQRHRLTWKRRALKEICAFLLLCNILLWIMPAFGARPQFDNPIGAEFYEFTMWAAVVNIGLPFGIFYRMHSVASLFEVFLTS
ncbi:proton channel OTOP2 [Oncorhynchus keta]|uniref:proton channel OTOP2 n=1 Tax=Oncorhynchus keta TaxID=8018 RepID=UPI00227C08FC|nr:proton channel OTOP2 [Oncorhynchus keta]